MQGANCSRPATAACLLGQAHGRAAWQAGAALQHLPLQETSCGLHSDERACWSPAVRLGWRRLLESKLMPQRSACIAPTMPTANSSAARSSSHQQPASAGAHLNERRHEGNLLAHSQRCVPRLAARRCIAILRCTDGLRLSGRCIACNSLSCGSIASLTVAWLRGSGCRLLALWRHLGLCAGRAFQQQLPIGVVRLAGTILLPLPLSIAGQQHANGVHPLCRPLVPLPQPLQPRTHLRR